MINEVIRSKALYNRSQFELPPQEFTLIEARELMRHRSIQEVLDAYLTVGGIDYQSGAYFSREKTSAISQQK